MRRARAPRLFWPRARADTGGFHTRARVSSSRSAWVPAVDGAARRRSAPREDDEARGIATCGTPATDAPHRGARPRRRGSQGLAEAAASGTEVGAGPMRRRAFPPSRRAPTSRRTHAAAQGSEHVAVRDDASRAALVVNEPGAMHVAAEHGLHDVPELVVEGARQGSREAVAGYFGVLAPEEVGDRDRADLWEILRDRSCEAREAAVCACAGAWVRPGSAGFASARTHLESRTPTTLTRVCRSRRRRPRPR